MKKYKNYNNMKYTAQVVVMNNDNKILSVSRKDDFTDMNLPGGKMEEIDKDIIDTAIRELFEETGIVVLREDLVLVYVIHKYGYMSYTYYAKNYTGDINHTEPHLVDWIDRETLLKGRYGMYNKEVFNSLDSLFSNN